MTLEEEYSDNNREKFTYWSLALLIYGNNLLKERAKKIGRYEKKRSIGIYGRWLEEIQE